MLVTYLIHVVERLMRSGVRATRAEVETNTSVEAHLDI